METLQLAKVAAGLAKDKKATRVVLQDLRGMSDICDYQLICSGQNDRQTRAICDEIQATLKKKHLVTPTAIEGKTIGHWILMDYGNLIIHIFYDYIRDYYALEEIWKDSQFISV